MEPDVPIWKLERFALGELPEDEAKALRERAERDPELARAIEYLAASNRGILFAHPPATVAAEVSRRIAGRPRRRSLWLGATLAAPALAAALLLMIVAPAGPSPTAPGQAGQPEITRAKGLSASLRAYRARDARPEPLAEGAEASARDVLQLAYVSAGRPWGVVVSLDGRGEITRHLPEEGTSSARLEDGGEVALPHAYELDEAPMFERFFLVTSTKPLRLSQVLDAARALAGRPDAMTAPLELPTGAEQTSLTLRKASR